MTTDVMPASAGPMLGVLGGMGPAATADFLAKLAARTPANRDQDHIATLVYSDPSTPDRSDAMIGSGPDPEPALRRGIRFLSEAGARVIAVPCNSAHYWFEAMQDEASVPVVHIVDAVAEQIRRSGADVTRLGLMSTDGTARSGVYSRLADHGLELLDLTDLGPASPVMSGIRAVKAGDLDGARVVLTEGARVLAERGAQGIIYGCTDISAVLGPAPAGIAMPVWDSADALAEASVAYIRDRHERAALSGRKTGPGENGHGAV
ncbi:amino acid racemase [Ruania suaedae]|uniref:aspartate/glutamate racemase family protein n=1 Tax=Ruania suaedae TaxID=2897774 RepID=UPI001E64332A|nr:amino acid racemase [Ruania suaedae]UFU02208.1 amino acid racemase [Ruania suaedae]